MSLTGNSKEPMRTIKGIVISYFSLETEVLDCFLYNKEPISRLKMKKVSGPKETQNKWQTATPLAYQMNADFQLQYCGSPRPYIKQLMCLPTPSFLFLYNILLLLGVEKAPLWPPNC